MSRAKRDLQSTSRALEARFREYVTGQELSVERWPVQDDGKREAHDVRGD